MRRDGRGLGRKWAWSGRMGVAEAGFLAGALISARKDSFSCGAQARPDISEHIIEITDRAFRAVEMQLGRTAAVPRTF